MDKIKEGL